MTGIFTVILTDATPSDGSAAILPLPLLDLRMRKYTFFSLASHAHLLVTALRCPWPAVLIAFLPSREGTCALSSFRPCHLPGVPEIPTAAPAFPLMALRRSGDSPRVPIIRTNRGIRRTTNFLPTEVSFEVSVFSISSKGKH